MFNFRCNSHLRHQVHENIGRHEDTLSISSSHGGTTLHKSSSYFLANIQNFFKQIVSFDFLYEEEKLPLSNDQFSITAGDGERLFHRDRLQPMVIFVP